MQARREKGHLSHENKLYLVFFILTCLCYCSWSADADTWYGEDADEEWIPSGSLNIMNKTAVSSWDSKNSFCHEEDGIGGKHRQHRSFLSEGQDFGFQSLDQKHNEV